MRKPALIIATAATFALSTVAAMAAPGTTVTPYVSAENIHVSAPGGYSQGGYTQTLGERTYGVQFTQHVGRQGLVFGMAYLSKGSRASDGQGFIVGYRFAPLRVSYNAVLRSDLSFGYSNVKSHVFAGTPVGVVGYGLALGTVGFSGYVHQAAVRVSASGSTLTAPVAVGITGAGNVGAGDGWYRLAGLFPQYTFTNGGRITRGEMATLGYAQGPLGFSVTWIGGLQRKGGQYSNNQGPREMIYTWPQILNDPAASYARGVTVGVSYKFDPQVQLRLSYNQAPTVMSKGAQIKRAEASAGLRVSF